MTRGILIGTSGFSYEDWRGPFYPESLPKSEMLDYYADVFPALEINATYYATPGRKTAESMVRRARGRLVFAVKAPGRLTHEGDLSPEVLDPWLHFLEPFRDAGKLSAVLLQFPAGLHADTDGIAYLGRVREALRGLPVVLEFRHSSWDSKETDARLADWQASRAMVDQPAIRGLSRSGELPYFGPIPYIRFHGRNAKAWYGGEEGSARYTYRYAESELVPWKGIIETTTPSNTALVFFNNHPQGNAVFDAESFATLMGSPVHRPRTPDLFDL